MVIDLIKDKDYTTSSDSNKDLVSSDNNQEAFKKEVDEFIFYLYETICGDDMKTNN